MPPSGGTSRDAAIGVAVVLCSFGWAVIVLAAFLVRRRK